MASPRLRGIYVPLVTPFAAEGGVALDALARVGDRLLGAGAAGLVPLGTTGEAALLDAGERRAVIETSARVCETRGAQLIAGAGSNSTRASVEAVRELADVPALAAVLVVVPYYLRPTQAGLVAHFEAVADASPAPIVIYNIPFTGCEMESETLLRLAEHPNVCGAKQSLGELTSAAERVLAEAPDDFAVLCGDDAHLLASVLLGGAGGITATAHFCTSRFVALVEDALAGRVGEARAHHQALVPVIEACFAEPSPAVFKALLHAAGEIPTPDVRLPFLGAAEESVDRARRAVAAAGG